MKCIQRKKKGRTLFEPDSIIAKINQAVSRDLGPLRQKYKGGQDALYSGCDRQVKEFTKKYSSPAVSKEALEHLAFQKFLDVNAHMASHCDRIDHDRVHFSRASRRDRILRRAKALVRFVLADVTEEQIFLSCRNSTGSTVGVPYADTSNEAKFTFPITLTERVKFLFDRYLDFDFPLKSAIQDLNCSQPLAEKYSIVQGSRATTVEKTSTSRRMICVEPTGNMFFQQGLMLIMYKRLDAVGLSVDSLPEYHRQLALESSITGKFSTIDWSSASDCVSIELLRYLLPPKWFYWVDLLRSPKMSINDKWVDLNMISTMGNAVTFPLETLTFWALGHAVILEQKQNNALLPEWEDLKLCSVFGDDCIVPTSCAPRFIEVLESFGFIVNDDKSFYGEEKFRESCGGDYLCGYDIRPYCVRSPSNCRVSSLEPWLYTITNSLIKKYIWYFGELSYVYDKELFKCLSSVFEEYGFELKFIPSFFPDDAGLKLAFDLQRFLACYKFRCSPISVNEHGTYRFKYTKFVYRKRKSRHDGIHFALWLRNPKRVLNPVMWINHRRNGGYVVAYGRSCHWHVPKIRG